MSNSIQYIDHTDITFRELKEYNALHDYAASKYDLEKNYLYIDEVRIAFRATRPGSRDSNFGRASGISAFIGCVKREI